MILRSGPHLHARRTACTLEGAQLHDAATGSGDLCGLNAPPPSRSWPSLTPWTPWGPPVRRNGRTFSVQLVTGESARLQRIGKHRIGDHSWQLSDAVGWRRGQRCCGSRICAGSFRLWLRVAAQAAARHTEPPGAWLKPRPKPTGLGLVVPPRRRPRRHKIVAAALVAAARRLCRRSNLPPPPSLPPALVSNSSPLCLVAAFIDVAIVVVTVLVNVVIVVAAAIVALPFSHSRPLSGTSRRCRVWGNLESIF